MADRHKRIISNFDLHFLIAVALLIGIGLTAVYSATYTMGGGSHALFKKQLVWIVFGLVAMAGLAFFDYRRLERWGYVLYGIALSLLLATLAVGHSGLGAQRWLPLGPFAFQPSEVAKLCIIIALAKYFAEDRITRGHTLRELIKPSLLVIVPVALVIKQPDLGTGLMFLFIFCAVVIVAGIRIKSFLYLTFASALSAPLMWGLLWKHLKDYQKKRLTMFLSPESDPSGAGYHIIQSKIAIGSGSLTGKGFLHGTQSQLSFLPERHTDFIFSVISEEWGFIGSITVLAVYLFIVLWGIETAQKSKDRFGSLLAVGAVAMIFFHIVINIGMTVGIMPVVGVPLPLVSYGGTSALTTLIALGLLASVNLRRFKLFY
jgi:rod shape determining protein RodA